MFFDAVCLTRSQPDELVEVYDTPWATESIDILKVLGADPI